MPYDPYAADSQNPTMTQELLGYLNPIEIAKFKYTTSPSIYGGSFFGVSKGVWMPIKFQDMNLSKYTRNVKKAFKHGGVMKGIGASVSPLSKAWDANNYIGGGYLRRSQQVRRFTSELDNTLFSYFDSMKRSIGGTRPAGFMNYIRRGAGQNYMTTAAMKSRYHAGKANQLSKMFRQDIVDWLDEAQDLAQVSSAALREKIMGRVSTREFIGTYGDLTGKVDDIIRVAGGSAVKTTAGKGFSMSTIGTEAIAARAKAAGLTKTVGGAAGKRAAIKSIGIGSGTAALGGAARLGLFAAKGFAFIGAASLLWDVTQAVAQPIGNLLVHEGNRIMDNFHARFMPELGGRLAMSYMTTGAATERQRAVSAISKAYINGRSAFGQEAAYSHS